MVHYDYGKGECPVMKKRMLRGMILLLCLLLAAPMTVCSAPASRVSFRTAKVTALSGDEAVVAIALENSGAQDIEGMILACYFDPAMLTLTSIAPTDKLPGAMINSSASGAVLVAWDDGARKGIVNGDIVTLTFRVTGGLSVGTEIPLTLQCRELFDTSMDMNDIPYQTYDGGVTVGDIAQGSAMGDVNGDGTVNAEDLVLARQMVYAQIKLGSIPGFHILPPSNQRGCADMNGDTLISVLDLTLLKRKIAGL